MQLGQPGSQRNCLISSVTAMPSNAAVRFCSLCWTPLNRIILEEQLFFTSQQGSGTISHAQLTPPLNKTRVHALIRNTHFKLPEPSGKLQSKRRYRQDPGSGCLGQAGLHSLHTFTYYFCDTETLGPGQFWLQFLNQRDNSTVYRSETSS